MAVRQWPLRLGCCRSAEVWALISDRTFHQVALGVALRSAMSSQTLHQIYKHCSAIHKFSARNLDNQRWGESIKSVEFEAAVERVAKHMSDAFEAMIASNDEASPFRKRKLASGEDILSERARRLRSTTTGSHVGHVKSEAGSGALMFEAAVNSESQTTWHTLGGEYARSSGDAVPDTLEDHSQVRNF